MAKIHWQCFVCGPRIRHWFWWMYNITRLTFRSLFYNHFADKYYIGDTLMEPMFWFVDHFTKVLGPVCVAVVILASSSLIIIAYVIGLPFYIKLNSFILLIALVIGHWILINVVFYYYKAFVTEPGYPPKGAMIAEAVTICKRCIAPKPPRTHHCQVCNRCILKMDHHCPWLNNCIGHFNHRYFFMFGAYSWVGVVFLILFGIPVAYDHFLSNSENSRIAQPVVDIIQSIAQFVSVENKNITVHPIFYNATNTEIQWPVKLYHSCLVYAAILCVTVLFVLGGLLIWHMLLISNGETSIEGHINKKERLRLSKNGKIYTNPYDFGRKRNWEIFLCIGLYRPWWYILKPFTEKPIGDGIQWNILNGKWDYEKTMKDSSQMCFIKMS